MLRLFRRDPNRPTIERLYGAIVAQARRPAFYRDLGVADSVQGRFDLILLHLVLFLHRLKGEPQAVRDIGQDVFDLFIEDMDRSLRDLGVGDTKVPKKMRTVAQAFYGRLDAYDGALAAADDAPLEAALARNLFPGADAPPTAPALARYVRRAVAHLAAQPVDALARGDLDFPAPDEPTP